MDNNIISNCSKVLNFVTYYGNGTIRHGHFGAKTASLEPIYYGMVTFCSAHILFQ